jgi:hypothetical protein
MAAEFPEVTYRFPLLILGTSADLRPDILIDWSQDIDTSQFSTANTRAALVQLLDESTSSVIDTEYVDYDATRRRLTLRPASDLQRDTLFTITIDRLVLASSGRRSKSVFRWQFRTAGTILGTASILDPADYSVQPYFPTFSWLAAPGATGTTYYTLQIDNRFDFISPLYTGTTTATALNPVGLFTENDTYYWRLLTWTPAATGAWTDIRQFYYGTVRKANESSSQTWYESDSFGVADWGWDNGLTNQQAFPTLSITFTSTLAANAGDYVTVWKRSLGPRNDQRSTYLESQVAGSWSVTGSTMTFTPGEALANNTRYEVRVSRRMLSADGLLLGEDIVRYFTGPYTPMYAHIDNIRSRFLSAEQNVPDDLINYYIYQASLQANARYYGYLQGLPMAVMGNALPESMVRDSSNLTSHGVGAWVAAVAAYSMLRAILYEMVRNVDSARKLGDYEYRLGPGFLQAMKMAMDDAKAEIEEWDAYLSPASPRTTTLSMYWSPDMRDYDWSVRDMEAKRDNLFIPHGVRW